MARLGLVIVTLAGGVHTGCNGGTPTAPTPVPPAPETLSTRIISGLVSDAVDQAALAGVTVSIDRHESVSTDERGAFVLHSEARPGRYRTTLSGPSVVTRRTTVWLREGLLTFPLIPSTFDMTAFDQFARSLFSSAIIRWRSVPALIVETSFVAEATRWPVALAAQVPEAELDRVVARLSEALPLLTGSAFTSFSSVQRRTMPAGGVFDPYDRGAITVVYYSDDDNLNACGRGGPQVSLPDLEIVAGVVWLRDGCASLPWNTRTMVHELGHALGYGHVTATPSVMGPTCCVDITPFDRAAGAIVSHRPPGNRAPDDDPEPVFGVSSLSAPGALVTLPPLPSYADTLAR